MSSSSSLITVFSDWIRFITLREILGYFIKSLTYIMEKCFPGALMENSARALAFHACEQIYRRTGDLMAGSIACAILISFLIYRGETPIYVFGSTSRYEVFGTFIQFLTSIVERCFPNSSPLAENSARTWTFYASERIYARTGDVILGSLACATLISFLISRDETPIYVFVIWAILVAVLCLIL